MKTHFSLNGDSFGVCGRQARRKTHQTWRVDCLACKNYDEFKNAAAAADLAAEAAFWAQTPRKYTPQFGAELVCECGSDLFRYKGRSCYGHFDDYKCAGCGKETSRITETGMCF